MSFREKTKTRNLQISLFLREMEQTEMTSLNSCIRGKGERGAHSQTAKNLEVTR